MHTRVCAISTKRFDYAALIPLNVEQTVWTSMNLFSNLIPKAVEAGGATGWG